jgi:hypothetical protein
MAVALNVPALLALGNPQTLDIRAMPDEVIIRPGGPGGYKLYQVDKYWYQVCISSLYKICDELPQKEWIALKMRGSTIVLEYKNQESVYSLPAADSSLSQ